MEEQKVEQAMEAVKAGGELALEAFVEKSYQPVVDAVVAKVKEAIPGEAFDVIAEGLILSLAPVVKAEMLKQIEKVSEKV